MPGPTAKMMYVVQPSIVDVIAAGRVADARALVFEYMAATQAETRRPVPATVAELPAVLRHECDNLNLVYGSPGILLTGYLAGQPAGCVGLIGDPGHGPAGTAEVKRLYVRPEHRGQGVARALMLHLHEHAEQHGIRKLVLDVLPSRTHVIAFYRDLGYADVDPTRPISPAQMVDMYLNLPR